MVQVVATLISISYLFFNFLLSNSIFGQSGNFRPCNYL